MRHLLLALLALPLLAAAADDDYTLLGAGIRTRPKFDGSREQVTDLIPVIRYSGRPWFARTTQGILEGGARANLARDFDVGVQLAYEQGPFDRDWSTSIGAHAEWDPTIGQMPLYLVARLRQHLDTDHGTQFDFRATAGVYEGHGFLIGVYAQATWASSKYFESYYGLRDSGLAFGDFGAIGSYDLTQRWTLVGDLHQRRLSDDAARGPAVERRTGTYASLGLAYKF